VAVAGEGAALADESVLAALDLAQVNLRTIRVATGRRIRRRLPGNVEIVPLSLPAADVTDIDGVPAMSLRRALLSSRGRIMPSRLAEAARAAAARGLLDHAEAEQAAGELE
jgi:hypothetical protein